MARSPHGLCTGHLRALPPSSYLTSICVVRAPTRDGSLVSTPHQYPRPYTAHYLSHRWRWFRTRRQPNHSHQTPRHRSGRGILSHPVPKIHRRVFHLELGCYVEPLHKDDEDCPEEHGVEDTAPQIRALSVPILTSRGLHPHPPSQPRPHRPELRLLRTSTPRIICITRMQPANYPQPTLAAHHDIHYYMV